jgi:hypothetical protein
MHGVWRQAGHAVLNWTATVTPEMALRFIRLTGGAPELYLSMQTGHDLEKARERLKDALDDIEPGPPPQPIRDERQHCWVRHAVAPPVSLRHPNGDPPGSRSTVHRIRTRRLSN